MKKLMAALCAGAMAVSLAVPSFAAYVETMTNGDQFRVSALCNGSRATGTTHTGGTKLTGIKVNLNVNGKNVASNSGGTAKTVSCSSNLAKGANTIKATGSGTYDGSSYRGTDTLRATVR